MSHESLGSCLLPLIDALVEAGNPYWLHPNASGPFYVTQGGYVCQMTYRIDFSVIRMMPRDPEVELLEDIDQIFCPRCWLTVYGGASTTLVQRRRERFTAR